MPRRPANLALYAHRRAHRLCVQCGAGLQPEDGRLCVEHAKAAAEALAKYKASAKGQAANQRSCANRYARRKAARQCVNCSRPALPNLTRCEECRVDNKVAKQNYLDRRDARAA